MKRLIVLLLALSIVTAADRRTWADDEKPKDTKKDDTKDKKDKKEEICGRRASLRGGAR